MAWWLAVAIAMAGLAAAQSPPAAAGDPASEPPARDASAQPARNGESALPLSPLRVPRRLGTFVPEAVAADAFGHVFALDRGSGRIVRFDPDGAVRAFSPGDQGTAGTPILTGLAARPGPDLYAIDDAAGLLYRFDLDGRLRATTSYADGLDEAGIQPGRATDFALGPSGELYLLDRMGARLFLFDRAGRLVTDLFAGLAGPARPRAPAGLAVAGDGTVLVLDGAGSRIRVFSREGVAQADWPGLEAGQAAEPPGLIAVTARGRVILVSRNEGRIWLRDTAGRLLAEDRLVLPSRTPLADAEAMGDTLLLLASPGGGEILRRRLGVLTDAENSDPR